VFLSAVSSWAAIRETYVYSRAPSESELAEVVSQPGVREFRVTLENPTSAELERVKRLPSRSRVDLRSIGYPSEAALSFWRQWAEDDRGEVMFLSDFYPTESEARRLDSIGLQRWSLAFAAYPAGSDVRRLNSFGGRPRLIFMAARYPTPVEQTPLLALDRGFPIEVISTQWTRYVHMDFLNRMPQRKRLTIWDVYPSATDLTYLEVIRDLDRLVIEADFDPASSEVWSKLARYPLVWVRTASLPSDAHLRALDEAYRAGSRFEELVIRLGRAPSAGERSRLEALSVPVALRIDI
jgi:hypothetical protein